MASGATSTGGATTPSRAPDPTTDLPTSNSGPTGAGPPTIPPDWRPPQPECNVQEAGYYVWEWGTTSRRIVWGGPAQTTECLPSGWGSEATFAAMRCPSDYTPVANACSWALDAVICCPTAFAFSCYSDEATPFYGNSYYRCASQFQGRVTVDATWTDVIASTGSVARANMSSPGNLFAVPIVYTTPTNLPSGPNTGPSSAPLPDSGPSSSDGLSAGARIGIGVGAGVGVLLVVATVFCMFWRRRRRQQQPQQPPPGPGVAGGPEPSSAAPKAARAELADHPPYAASTPSPALGSPYPVVAGRHEMEGEHHRRSELP